MGQEIGTQEGDQGMGTGNKPGQEDTTEEGGMWEGIQP